MNEKTKREKTKRKQKLEGKKIKEKLTCTRLRSGRREEPVLLAHADVFTTSIVGLHANVARVAHDGAGVTT